MPGFGYSLKTLFYSLSPLYSQDLQVQAPEFEFTTPCWESNTHVSELEDIPIPPDKTHDLREALRGFREHLENRETALCILCIKNAKLVKGLSV